MRFFSTFFALILSGMLLANSAFAMDRDTLSKKYATAKSSGYIGERPDGYLGVIQKQGDAEEIVTRINSFRKKKYENVANSNNVPLSTVESQAGQKLLEKAEPGQFILLNGRWMKK